MVTRDDERLNIKPFAARTKPLPIPATNPFEEPTRTLTVNAAWASHLIGVLEVLAQPDAWLGSESEIEQAMQAILEMQNMLSMED